MAAFVSLFDQLGVTPDSSDADVEIAFERKKVEAEQSGSAITNGLAYAYKVLRTQAGRQAYVEFLRHCEEHIPIPVPPERRDEFRAFWAFAGIRSWPIPNRPGYFELRRPDQEVPGFVHAGPPAQPVFRSAARAIWGFVTLRPFVGASRDEKVGLLVLYALVIAAIVYAGDWASNRFGAWQESRLRSSVENHLALAKTSLDQLGTEVSSFSNDFRTVTGGRLGETVRSPEMDSLILKDGTVPQALADIENLRLKDDELSKARESLWQIRERVARSVYRNEDDAELERLIRWCEGGTERLRTIDDRLEHLRVMLRISRFEQGIDETERTPP